MLPKAQGDSSPEDPPLRGARHSPHPWVRTPAASRAVPKPRWDKSRQPAQEPQTSGAVSPGPHGAAGRQRQWQLRERCVGLCWGNLGGRCASHLVPTILAISSSPAGAAKLGTGEVSNIFPLGSQTVLKFRVWRRCHLPRGSCWELKQQKEEKQSALGQVACERGGIENSGVVLARCRLTR